MFTKNRIWTLVVSACVVLLLAPATALADSDEDDNRVYRPEGTWIAEERPLEVPYPFAQVTSIGHGMYNVTFASSWATRTNLLGTIQRTGHNKYGGTFIAYGLDTGGGVEAVTVIVPTIELVDDGVMDFSPHWGVYTPDQAFPPFGDEEPLLGCFPISGVRYLRIDH
jgi:hypothetical protein